MLELKIEIVIRDTRGWPYLIGTGIGKDDGWWLLSWILPERI